VTSVLAVIKANPKAARRIMRRAVQRLCQDDRDILLEIVAAYRASVNHVCPGLLIGVDNTEIMWLVYQCALWNAERIENKGETDS
jgi:hypothetical protein